MGFLSHNYVASDLQRVYTEGGESSDPPPPPRHKSLLALLCLTTLRISFFSFSSSFCVGVGMEEPAGHGKMEASFQLRERGEIKRLHCNTEAVREVRRYVMKIK